MHVSCKEWQPKEPRRHFLPQKLLCQPLLWRWRVFNTHFSWQHQRGTRQVKQIYLGRVWSRVWTGFKAARCAAPHACLWLCNPYRCTWSFHSSPCRALNHKSDKFSFYFVVLRGMVTYWFTHLSGRRTIREWRTVELCSFVWWEPPVASYYVL